MNFFQYLKNNKNSDSTQKNNKLINQHSSNFLQEDLPSVEGGQNPLRNPLYHSSVLKKGDTIKIIYYPNSYYNSYKGYYGEIKDYKKSQSFALVHIYTSTSTRTIRLPIDHFIKI